MVSFNGIWEKIEKPQFLTATGCLTVALLTATSPISSNSTILFDENCAYTEVLSTHSTEMYAYNLGDMTLYIPVVIETKLEKNIKRLNQISEFEDNWNGYGAHPFTPEFVASVCELVKDLDRQPEIFPTAQNTIQFEYDKDNGDYLELEIFEDGTVDTFVLLNNGESNENTIENKAEAINRLVKDFYG